MLASVVWVTSGLLLAASAGRAAAQISDDVVKIGVLTDLSGPASDPNGLGSVESARMAIEDFGGKVAGKSIELVFADHQIKADVGLAIARQWYDVDKVDIIVDVPISVVGLGVQQLSKEKQKLMITMPTGVTDFTGKLCTPYSMQWVFNTYALAAGTAREVVKRGGDTWFFLTADYTFGYQIEADAAKVVRENGGKVLGSVRHPFQSHDLSSFILQAQASGAKIIGLASGPPDNTTAIRLGAEYGLFAAGQKMAALLIPITDVHALTLEKAQELVLTTSFYWDMDEETRAWSKRFYARMNKMPTMWQAGIYSAVTHYLKAIAETGTDEPLKVAAKMRDMPVQDFFSRHGRLREDGLMVHDLYVVEVKTPAESKYPWDYYRIISTIPAEQAFQPPDPACPLVK